jgi:hypothetical protein
LLPILLVVAAFQSNPAFFLATGTLDDNGITIALVVFNPPLFLLEAELCPTTSASCVVCLFVRQNAFEYDFHPLLLQAVPRNRPLQPWRVA